MTIMENQKVVFIVDDDAAVRKGLELSLKERGYTVISFPSAEAFLADGEINQPGCLVLDIRMGGMSGLQLQDELRQRNIRLPIIFISGHGSVPTTAHAMRRGAIDFLEKPYELSTLIKRVEEAFELDSEHRRVSADIEALDTRLKHLTAREWQILRLLTDSADGRTNRQIAALLGISIRTVETHRARIMEKLRAKSFMELVSAIRLYESVNPGFYDRGPASV